MVYYDIKLTIIFILGHVDLNSHFTLKSMLPLLLLHTYSFYLFFFLFISNLFTCLLSRTTITLLFILYLYYKLYSPYYTLALQHADLADLYLLFLNHEDTHLYMLSTNCNNSFSLIPTLFIRAYN